MNPGSLMRAVLIGVSLAFAAASVAQEGDRRAAIERAYDEVVAARAALQRAEAAREQGIEPLPGERLGTEGGRSRLAPSYWDRQEALDSSVEQARQRLDEALARWNAVR